MVEPTVKTGLIKDFDELYDKGSGNSILETCETLLSLAPVRMAITKGATGPKSTRVLLQMTAERADGDEDKRYVLAGAAITGVKPESTLPGVRGVKGPQTRAENAGEIDGVGPSTARKKRENTYYPAYVDAVLELADNIMQDSELRKQYLHRCGVIGDTHLGTESVRALAEVHPESLVSHVVRHIPLSQPVQNALDAARTSCEVHNQRFFTPNLLLALLEMDSSSTTRCFDTVQPGLAQWVRTSLHQYLSMTTGVQTPNPFVPFEWVERADVQRAQELAHQSGAAVATDLHLLLGILDTESRTQQDLSKRLGPAGLERLREVATRMLQEQVAYVTPGPVLNFDDSN